MACQCFECSQERENMGDYWLRDEELRIYSLLALGFDEQYVFKLIWGE